MDELRKVLSGSEPDGIEWAILAGEDPVSDDFWTFIRRSCRGSHPAQSGMGGPKLFPGAVVNVWAGQADGTPPFVLIRADPSVERVVATTLSGATRELALSPTIDDFGLRFGARPFSHDDVPDVLTVEVAGGETRRSQAPWPRRPERC